MVALYPPMVATAITAPTPDSRPAKTNEPNRIRSTRTPDSRLTSRLAPTKRMCLPSGVNASRYPKPSTRITP